MKKQKNQKPIKNKFIMVIIVDLTWETGDFDISRPGNELAIIHRINPNLESISQVQLQGGWDAGAYKFLIQDMEGNPVLGTPVSNSLDSSLVSLSTRKIDPFQIILQSEIPYISPNWGEGTLKNTQGDTYSRTVLVPSATFGE